MGQLSVRADTREAAEILGLDKRKANIVAIVCMVKCMVAATCSYGEEEWSLRECLDYRKLKVEGFDGLRVMFLGRRML